MAWGDPGGRDSDNILSTADHSTRASAGSPPALLQVPQQALRQVLQVLLLLLLLLALVMRGSFRSSWIAT